MTKTPITNKLISAYRVARPAKEALANVEWGELPGLLLSLGCGQSPEVCSILAAGIGDRSLQSYVVLRNTLAAIGDSAKQRQQKAQRRGNSGSTQKVIANMCSELCNLTGASLALIDATLHV